MKNLITSISSKNGAEFRFYHGNNGEYADMYDLYWKKEHYEFYTIYSDDCLRD